MAPTRSTSSTVTAPRKSILKNANRPKPVEPESLFPSSKRDKRKIKHEQLISKIAKSAHPKTRRRRANKKLVTTLDALADALPETGEALAARSGISGHQVQDQVNVIQRKSMKSKPGAMRRREKVDKGERDRFAKNLAQMAGAREHGSGPTESDSQSETPQDRWKALRGFIAQTMEKKPGIST